jgi:2-succinyl-6-hydroxy-2,4-cyclohexadiene-1-carboxylate synthase
MLATRTWGSGDPVALLHGFTQSAAAWEPLARRLADDHLVIGVDLPGHGGSAAVPADLWSGADLIVEAVTDAVANATTVDPGGTVGAPSGGNVAAASGGGRPGAGGGALVGYSLGGRFALHVALAHPDTVARLVVVSATGGIDDAPARAERRAADEAVARRVERDGVEAFVRWWLERPLFSTLPASAAALESRLGGSAAGLASSLRLAGAGAQEPLWDRLDGLSMPVLVVAGALDPAYRERAERLVATIGANAHLAIVAGAGHACHLEAPDAWLDVVEPFLAGEPPPAR